MLYTNNVNKNNFLPLSSYYRLIELSTHFKVMCVKCGYISEPYKCYKWIQSPIKPFNIWFHSICTHFALGNSKAHIKEPDSFERTGKLCHLTQLISKLRSFSIALPSFLVIISVSDSVRQYTNVDSHSNISALVDESKQSTLLNDPVINLDWTQNEDIWAILKQWKSALLKQGYGKKCSSFL